MTVSRGSLICRSSRAGAYFAGAMLPVSGGLATLA